MNLSNLCLTSIKGADRNVANLNVAKGAKFKLRNTII